VEDLLDSAQRLAALVLDGGLEGQDEAVMVSGFGLRPAEWCTSRS